MTIHASAIIHPSAEVGKDVQIDPYAVVGPDCNIGDRCHLMPHTTVEYTELGEDCVVYPQASLGLTPQHLQYKGEKTKLVAGKRNIFRESVTVHRGTLFDQGLTQIGDDNYFMAMSHVAHDCVVGNKVVMVNSGQISGHVKVGDGAFISGMVGVHQFVRIGMGVIISGGSMVGKDVAPFCIAQGDRAVLRGLNLVGMRRLGLKRDSIKAIKDAYRTMFLSGFSFEEALQQPALTHSSEATKIFREFFVKSKRGYLRPLANETSVEAPEEVLL